MKKCFISYCSDDIKPMALRAFIRLLEDRSQGQITFLCDLDNALGKTIKSFMDEIDKCDAVIMVCSPRYKEKISINNTNVAYEFKKICQRLARVEKLKESGSNYDDENFAILPVIFSPYEALKITKNDAFPEFLDRKSFVYKRYYFDDLAPTGSKKEKSRALERKSKIENINSSIIAECVNQIFAISYNRSVLYQANSDQIIQKIVDNTKAESSLNLGRAFYETWFYKKLKHQDVHVIIGRKGSGKTQALTQLLFEEKAAIKGHVKIDANNISLSEIFDYLVSPDDDNIALDLFQNFKLEHGVLDSTSRDIITKFSCEEFFDFVWTGYIYVYSMYIVACEYFSEPSSLTSKQRQDFEVAASYINDLGLVRK